jgi:RIO-like serine/threonine protein kinase
MPNLIGGDAMERSYLLDQQAVDYLSSLVAKDDLKNRYPLLGEGLSGQVFSFEDYAVKVYKEDCSEKNDYLMLANLEQHPLFPTLHYQTENFMVVDQVKGYTLAQLRDAGYKLKDNQFRQLEKVVEECYAANIIPHDIHLNNIMLDEQGNIKIIDVGRFFYSDHKEDYQDKIREDLDKIKYHCGLFSLFSSFRRKKRRYYTSSRPHHRHYTSSSGRHRYRRHYTSSGHHRHRRHHRSSFSFSFS